MSQRSGGIAATLLLSCLLTLCAIALSRPTAAQEDQGQPKEPEATSAQGAESEDEKEAKREAKRRAREARIEEYLRKKEERLAQRELERRQKEQEQAVDLATFAEEPAAAPAGTEKKQKRKAPPAGEPTVQLPRNLARVQQIVRSGPLGDDPTVQAYLDLIDQAEASPHQLAAFGSFLADSGWPAGAIEYYRVSLALEPGDPVLWINAGTIHRQMHENSAAVDAYRRALAIAPNFADAHYNLGATLDAMGKYEDALLEYKIALTLDPALADPSVNPQAANNARLVAVKLMLYEEQAGHLGLPLTKVPGGELPGASESDEGSR